MHLMATPVGERRHLPTEQNREYKNPESNLKKNPIPQLIGWKHCTITC